MSELTGYLYDNTGTAISSATVQLLTKNTTTQIASTTTNSDGKWAFSGQAAAAYDVKITFGSSVRYIKGDQEVQATMGEFIGGESAATYPLRVENSTNSASNAVLELRGNNSTRADGDEIYVSFKLDNDAGEETEFARITAEANDVSNGSEDGELRYSVMSGGSLSEVFVMSSAIGGGTAFDITTSTVSMATDSFTIKSEDDGSAAVLNLQADQGDDNADKWSISVADGGTMTLNSEISGSAVAHMTIAPNSTVANSTTTIHGTLTMGSTAALTNAGLVAVANQSNITGVGTISSGTWQGTAIASTYIAADAITGAKIADDAVNSEHYTDGSIDTAHIADNQVTLAKMAGLTRGSLIIGDASGDPSALTKGSANYILTSDGTDIAWAAAPDATNSSHVLVTDNESTDEENLVTFVEGATSSTGNVGLEMDGNLTYNPSSGTLTATAFAGNITGNVTGNASGTAATVTAGTQANITTLANLTTSGALNAGSITSGFGTIDVGSSTITTTGTVTTGNIELGHANENTLSGSGGVVSLQGVPIKTAGVENIWVPATAMTPRDNAGCASITTVAAGTNGRPDFHVLDFDKDTDEHAQFSIAMPKSWDGGNINAYFYWIGIAATTGVAWATQVLALNDNEEINAAYGTAVVTQDDSQGDATELLISAKSGDIACSGADGDLLYFQVFRDIDDGNDDMNGDARLVGILFEYTTNAATDA